MGNASVSVLTGNPCPECKGSGMVPSTTAYSGCPTCNGTGQESVPLRGVTATVGLATEVKPYTREDIDAFSVDVQLALIDEDDPDALPTKKEQALAALRAIADTARAGLADSERLTKLEAEVEGRGGVKIIRWDHDGRRWIHDNTLLVHKMAARGGEDETLRDALDDLLRGDRGKTTSFNRRNNSGGRDG